jgi:opacity protein-like surface antigen
MRLRNFGTALIAALVLMLGTATARAHDCDLSFSGGLSMPMGDFKDEDKLDGRSGPLFGADFHYHVSPKIAIGVDLSYMTNKHGAEGTVEDVPGGTLTADKDKFNTIHYGVQGKYFFSTAGKIDPFFTLGLGFWNLKEDYEYTFDDGVTQTVFTDESDEALGDFEQPGSRFGYTVGVGLTYMTSAKMGLGLGLDYNSISMDKDKFGVSTVPYLGITGRLTFHFAK